MQAASVVSCPITKVKQDRYSNTEDILAIEEPLEIRLGHWQAGKYIQKNISITMRTPGSDAHLATGFLFTEGIIRNGEEIENVTSISENIILINLKSSVLPDIAKLERHFYTTSSCGVCGKSSIESIKTICNVETSGVDFEIPATLAYQLPQLLRKHQNVFEQTGGLHASALFNINGELLLIQEDVGRHNALDKLIGYALQKNMLPLDNHILLLSGRASFELIQKATMAGIKMVAAVGAPSSLAVQLACENNITLIGFLREERFNIYCAPKRIVL